MHDFSSVFSDKPGCTDLLKHRIVMDQSPLVRDPLTDYVQGVGEKGVGRDAYY